MHRPHQESKKTVLTLFLLFNFLLIILAACGNVIPTDNPGYATWTPSPSATATCSPNIRLSTPEGWESSSRLIIILYDPRSVGDQYLELMNGEKTQDISYFISRIIPLLMKPGDQVSVFQFGYSEYEVARVMRLYSYLNPPPLYNTPSPRDTLTPLPPTKIPTPGYGAVATANFVRAQLTAIAGTEAANAAYYNCEILYWNNNVKVTATAWHVTATAEVGEINNKIDEELENFNNSRDKVQNPSSDSELYYGGVYYGLHFATLDLQADCEKYDDCILIIIDDLHIHGANNPDKLLIELGGVKKIYAIMPDCRDINQPSCKELKDYWNNEFKQFGFEDDDIEYWNGVRVELNLLNAIGR